MKYILLLIVTGVVLGSCSNDSEENESLQTPNATAATEILATEFKANWNLVSNATEYKVQYSTDNSFAQNQIMDNVGGPTNISNVESNTEYFYRVSASTNNGSQTSYSNVISLYTLPLAPVATEATNVSSNQFTANWSMVSGVSSYLLYVSTSLQIEDGNDIVPGYDGIEINGNTLDVIGLESNTVYHYAIKSKSEGRVSEFSLPASVLTDI